MTHRSSFSTAASVCFALSLAAFGCDSDDDAKPADKPTGEKMDAAEKPPKEPEQTGTSEWTMMGYDVASTYFNKAETKLTRENAAQLEVAYTVEMAGNVYGAPLQVGDRIYANAAGTVRALNAATGEEIWQAKPGATSGSMSYSDGLLYINTTGSKLVALKAEDGSQAWSAMYHPTQMSDGTSSPLPAGDVVLVGGSNGGIELGGGMFRGFLSAVDRKTGEVRWSTFTTPEGTNGASIWSSPSADVEGGFAYAGTGNNYGPPASDTSDCIIQFDLKTGTINYKYQATKDDAFSRAGGGPDYDFGANPVLYEAMLDGKLTKLASAGDKGGVAHAMRRDTGAEVWRRTLGTGSADGQRGIFTNSTWTGKYMLFALNEMGTATLFALDGATGDMRWMRKLNGPVWGRTAVANGVGFVGAGMSMEVFDVETGELIKAFPSKGGTLGGTITIANGRVAYGEGMTWFTTTAGKTLTVLALP